MRAVASATARPCRCLALLLFPEISVAAETTDADCLRAAILAEIEEHLVASLHLLCS